MYCITIQKFNVSKKKTELLRNGGLVFATANDWKMRFWGENQRFIIKKSDNSNLSVVAAKHLQGTK
jgi:hypothetical protein